MSVSPYNAGNMLIVYLVGYNIRNDLVQNKIRKLLLSLRHDGCMLPSLYSRYVIIVGQAGAIS